MLPRLLNELSVLTKSQRPTASRSFNRVLKLDSKAFGLVTRVFLNLQLYFVCFFLQSRIYLLHLISLKVKSGIGLGPSMSYFFI